MGGMGSGRRAFSTLSKSTTEDYRDIDVRWLKRQSGLQPGLSGQITWRRRGEITGQIGYRVTHASVVLDYRIRDRAGEWESLNYPIPLDTTPCHLGGVRHWFLCPSCGKRVALVYGGRIFACRDCYRLAYPSTRETRGDRAARRADRIRDKLGWEGGILNGPEVWNKPKGMHWQTFGRLVKEHDHLVALALAGFADQFGWDLERDCPF